jgi:hypothetical protein
MHTSNFHAKRKTITIISQKVNKQFREYTIVGFP